MTSISLKPTERDYLQESIEKDNEEYKRQKDKMSANIASFDK